MGYHDEERIQREKEEKRLQDMSVEQLRVELDERLKACLIEEIQALPERVSKHLDNAAWHIICASLGMKKDHWHDSKWEIADGSKGSPLAKALGEHVLSQVKTAIPDFIEGLVVGDPKIPPIKTAYTKAYKEQLAQLVNNQIWEVAQSNAQKRFREIMEQISNGQKVTPVLSDEDDDADA
jgi:predicted house-cleaning noncanonical NTP pyrophosphatase (MazG superfamily)